MTKLLELDRGQFFIWNYGLYLVTDLVLKSDIIQHVMTTRLGIKRLGTSTPPSFHINPRPTSIKFEPETLVELLS